MTNEKTGYGNPPKNTQFKKGQSGNPSGRPKKEKQDNSVPVSLLDIDKVALEFASKELSFKTASGEQTMSGLKALIQAQMKSALGGNGFSLKDILNRVDRTQAKKKAAEIDEYDRQKESYVFWKNYKENCQEHINKAIAEEGSQPLFDIHPDDIIIKQDYSVDIVGPRDIESRRKTAENMAFRDAFILQNALDRRLKPDSQSENHSEDVLENDGALVLAQLCDQQLPPRLQLSQSEWFMKLNAGERFTKRELLKAVPASWIKLKRNGHSATALWHPRQMMKRGSTTPSVTATVRMLKELSVFMHELLETDREVTIKDGRELVEIILEARAS